MIKETLKDKYGEENLIFTHEILDSFPSCTKGWIFRHLHQEVAQGEIIHYSHGVYYIPSEKKKKSRNINVEQLMTIKYLSRNGKVYGIYTGNELRRFFNLSKEKTEEKEIVTNNEHMTARHLSVMGNNYCLHHSRVEITKDNYPSYTILELFSYQDDKIKIKTNEWIKAYLMKHHVNYKTLMPLIKYFPSKTSKRLIESGILMRDSPSILP